MSSQTTQNPLQNHASNDAGLSIGQILGGFWSRKWFVLGFMVIVMVASFGIVKNLKPQYNASAKILIQGHDPDTNRFSANNQSSPADLLKVTSEAQVIQSHDLADKVIGQLKLKDYSEFNGRGQDSFMGFGGSKSGNGALSDIVRENYFDKLTVYPIAETRVVVVEFRSQNAKRAADMANTLAARYVENTRQTPFAKNAQTNSYLERQIKKLKSEILSSEKNIEKFRARNGLIQGNNGTLYAQELAELNRKIAEVSSVRAEASAKAASAKRLLGGDQSIDIAADVINSNLIQRLREEQIKLRRQITELSTTYLPAHPQMVQLNNQLQNLDRLVAFEVTKIAASLTDQAKIATARENTLRAKLNRLKAKAAGQGQSAARLKSMVRDVEAKRTLLNNYLGKQADTLSLRDVSNIPYGARIISKAVVSSKPAFPKTGPILFLAFVSAFVLAFVMSFLRDVTKGTSSAAGVYRPAPHMTQTQDAQPHMQTPVNSIHPSSQTGSGMAPYTSAQPLGSGLSSFNVTINDTTDMTALYGGNTQLTNDLMQLASHAQQFLTANRSKFLLVTSQDKYPKKSFISAGLARLLAGRGLRVIVIDADMLSPSISQLMGVQPGPGFSEVLLGAHPFSETVIQDRNSGASVMPAGMRGTQAFGQFGTDATGLVLRSLSMVYDIIIIHAPALSEHAGVQGLSRVAPYVCLAGNKSKSDKQRLADTAKSLLASGAAHVSQIQCSAKSGGLLGGLFKSKAA